VTFFKYNDADSALSLERAVLRHLRLLDAVSSAYAIHQRRRRIYIQRSLSSRTLTSRLSYSTLVISSGAMNDMRSSLSFENHQRLIKLAVGALTLILKSFVLTLGQRLIRYRFKSLESRYPPIR
jgi:hypothetical protein